jgi:glycosyltransferase involved in cell wall biosynthesis
VAVIGVDLTPLQGPHRMRGVGSTVINVMRHLSSKDKADNSFVFYLYKDRQSDALSLIDSSSFNQTTVRTVSRPSADFGNIKTLSGLFSLPKRIRSAQIDKKLGTRRITDVNDLDVFLQFEQDIIPPKDVKSILVAYDLIPYILEADYLWSYQTARFTHRYSRRGAVLASLRRHEYIQTIRAAAKRASTLVAISEQTKKDFVRYAQVPAEKIEVVYLGVTGTKNESISKSKHHATVDRYVSTSWGDVKKRSELPTKPYLLFVGGVDPRRKLEDLIAAFNMLKAQGNDISLVLAGDTMLGPNSVPNKIIKKALLGSSYLDDIYMLGFISDELREHLYKNALAFVYPTKYEGFGLPVLEAMRYGTPVITYEGSSVSEIAKKSVLYSNDAQSIRRAVQLLLDDPATRQFYTSNGMENANRFQWPHTSAKIVAFLLK